MHATLNLTLVVAVHEKLVAAAEQESVSPQIAGAAALTEFDPRDSAWTTRSQIAREFQAADDAVAASHGRRR